MVVVVESCSSTLMVEVATCTDILDVLIALEVGVIYSSMMVAVVSCTDTSLVVLDEILLNLTSKSWRSPPRDKVDFSFRNRFS
ncbi:hypothetical protein ACJIZ3_011995 [Penstemon smallii]|uniref:Uncharacterized protein n=1 Tax=Penstemon smallii TaxID=265156 RepID=A0ABD3UQ28_9LAMI